MKDKITRPRKSATDYELLQCCLASLSLVCASWSTRQSSADTNMEAYWIASGRCLAEMQLLETSNAFRLPLAHVVREHKQDKVVIHLSRNEGVL